MKVRLVHDARVPARRTPFTRSQAFRARPWPVPVGSEADLDAKCDTLTRVVDTETDFEFLLTQLDFDLFAQESWREKMWTRYNNGDLDDLMNSDADDAFDDIKDEMCADGTFGNDTSDAVREMVRWLMTHDLANLKSLLKRGLLHVNLTFTSYDQEFPRSGYAGAESLLALAASEVCSPAAVRLLLDHGADPNVELVHRLGDVVVRGPGGLACQDVRRDWTNNATNKRAILTALANAGGEMCDAYSEYVNCQHTNRPWIHDAFQLCSTLLSNEQRRNYSYIRHRFENVVALVGIVSFWRRAAAAPDSKAARAAIARVVKRARTYSH